MNDHDTRVVEILEPMLDKDRKWGKKLEMNTNELGVAFRSKINVREEAASEEYSLEASVTEDALEARRVWNADGTIW